MSGNLDRVIKEIIKSSGSWMSGYGEYLHIVSGSDFVKSIRHRYQVKLFVYFALSCRIHEQRL
jgi:hypothetical protein